MMAPTRFRHRQLIVSGTCLAAFACIVSMSLLPESNAVFVSVSPAISDLAHIPAYGLLTLLTAVAVLGTTRPSLLKLVLIVLIMSLLGGAIEIVQPFAGRTASLTDFWRNLLGATLAAGGCYLWMRWCGRVKRQRSANSGAPRLPAQTAVPMRRWRG